MKAPTEIRKGDIKKSIILCAVCLAIFLFLYLRWFKAAEVMRSTIAEDVKQVQIKLQNSTRAEQRLKEIGEKISCFDKAVKEVESTLPTKEELIGTYGKKILEKLGEKKLSLLSMDNSEPEKEAEGLYRIEYEISLSGEYTEIFSFISGFEKDFWSGFREINIDIIEENVVKVKLIFILYGVGS